MARKSEPSESEWAELREAQLKALTLPNTAVVPIIDIGDPDDIHPRVKKPVGERLAHAAVVVAYGKEGPATGPVYNSMEIKDTKIIVSFKNAGKGLKVRGNILKGFAISGEDMNFLWAQAEVKGDKVVVWNKSIKVPVAVRYAWADNPDCNLYNEEGLAASPFRTDNWAGLTDNRY